MIPQGQRKPPPAVSQCSASANFRLNDCACTQVAADKGKPTCVLAGNGSTGAEEEAIASSQPAEVEPAGDAAKRGRNLQKKLRQIQQLKERQGQTGLSLEQQEKLAGEQAIINELRSLGLQ